MAERVTLLSKSDWDGTTPTAGFVAPIDALDQSSHAVLLVAEQIADQAHFFRCLAEIWAHLQNISPWLGQQALSRIDERTVMELLSHLNFPAGILNQDTGQSFGNQPFEDLMSNAQLSEGLMEGIYGAVATGSNQFRWKTDGTIYFSSFREVGDRNLFIQIHEARPATVGETLVQALKDALNLTTAEAEVAAMFVCGRTLAEIADQRKVSLETVRSQIASVRQKSGHRLPIEFATVNRIK